MKRRIVYLGAIPQDTDVLYSNLNAMIADGFVAQGILGTSTLFSGLACSPTGPATLTVNVAPGCVYSQQNIDNSAFGSLNSNTTEQIVKIGISLDTLNFACPSPATTGQSVVYLIEAAFVEEDTGATVLPYYNAANPATPWAGPSNLGTSQNTFRDNICSVQVKAGVPATTGTQTTPAPDVGFTGLWAVTVAHGQTTVTSGNISQVGGAPFISETLTQKISQATADARYGQITAIQNSAYNFANDTSGSANTITASLTPAPLGYTKGMPVTISIANTNTGPTNINLNGLGNVPVIYKGAALSGGEVVATQNSIFTHDGTSFELNSPSGTTTSPLFSTGDVKLTLKNTADTGWVMAQDGTIGNAASGASERANADTSALFALLWTNISNTYAPVSGGRGGSAAADFAANKTIQLTAMMGRTLGIAGAGATLTSRALGQTLGEETHTMLLAEMVSHGHTLTDPGHFHNASVRLDGLGSPYNQSPSHNTSNFTDNGPPTPDVTSTDVATTGITISNAGSTTPFNVMQPTSFINAMIKL